MSIITYLRVSTTDQAVQNQRQAITASGWQVDKEFVDDAVSGTTVATSRSGWSACLAYIREGDTLVVYALDRLGRSAIDVLTQINLLSERGIRLVILKQGFDTDTPAGKLALTMFAAFAEFEHGIRKERQIEGIARARIEGKYQGRKPKLSAEQQAELLRRFNAHENRSELARQFGIDRATVHRYCNAVT
ncbi:recombinase family protein [Duganella sp. BJB488]|uniref:recombinase family protein n=1 Tax=unclassified Duganella TaxID=2636909 RepID=UPI000E34C786|nr:MULTISPECIES: recombinase family protein [unclassified Duganella]RFP17892.1 recombinase family protein [Duganella sp. BJB489]RFP17980.1 recombinase family protein [Duganella sp. BJB488]RFP37735.1 recombinase family protein [Duganella sp. BJB480]